MKSCWNYCFFIPKHVYFLDTGSPLDNSGVGRHQEVWHQDVSRHPGGWAEHPDLAWLYCSGRLALTLTLFSILAIIFVSVGPVTIQQGSISDRNQLPCRVPFQAAQDLIQDQNLSPKHWWERSGLPSHHLTWKLETGHQDWPGKNPF